MKDADFDALWSSLCRRTASREPLLVEGGRILDATALVRGVEQTAEALARADIRLLALAAAGAPDWVILDLACALAKITVVPVPPFFTATQIDHLLAPADAIVGDRAAIVSAGFSAARRELRPGVDLGFNPRPVAAAIPPETAKITFTSGSTGTPRGVCLSIANQLRVAGALHEAVGIPRVRHLCVLPLATLLENVAGIYAPLLAGGRVHFADCGPGGATGVAPAALTAVLDQEQPQSIILVPELLRLLVDATDRGWRPPASLRFAAVGGGRIAPGLIRSARDRGLPVYEGYGLSECASVVSLNTPRDDCPGSAGRPLPHLRVNTRDGELMVSGNAFLGYLNERASWGRTTVPTGDLGRIDARGFVRVTGRRDHLIVTTMGRNISPEWVEAELLADGTLRQAVVFGDGRPWCTALLYPAADTDDDALTRHVAAVNAGLPEYARIRTWHRLAEPLSSRAGLLSGNGRLRRAAIEEYFSAAIDGVYRQYQESSR